MVDILGKTGLGFLELLNEFKIFKILNIIIKNIRILTKKKAKFII